MSRKVVWDPRALDDFDQILDYLSEQNPAAAESVERKLSAAVERLAHHSIGRRGRIEGYFEKPVTGAPYIVSDQLTDAGLVIIRIVHQCRNWPEGDWPRG